MLSNQGLNMYLASGGKGDLTATVLSVPEKNHSRDSAEYKLLPALVYLQLMLFVTAQTDSFFN